MSFSSTPPPPQRQHQTPFSQTPLSSPLSQAPISTPPPPPPPPKSYAHSSSAQTQWGTTIPPPVELQAGPTLPPLPLTSGQQDQRHLQTSEQQQQQQQRYWGEQAQGDGQAHGHNRGAEELSPHTQSHSHPHPHSRRGNDGNEVRPQTSMENTSRQPGQIDHLPDEGWIPDMLQQQSKHDLHTLLQNSSLLNALVYAPQTAHPALAPSTTSLNNLLAHNVNLARTLQHLLENLEHARNATAQHLLTVRGAEQAWKKKQAQLESRLEAFGPRVLHGRLVASITEQEAVCVGVEESFMEGEGVAGEREVGEWLRRVKEGRRLIWLRRERKGRWDEGRVGGWR